jgi:ATP-dependent exoDNAse (exonuclease V) beta subunit
MMDRAISSQPAMDFVRLLIDDVVPAMNKLRGPITIMPEVKLSSLLGIAGTIDLVVIDGEGRAHIFDYKTKR